MTTEDGGRIGLPLQDLLGKKDPYNAQPRMLQEVLYQQENIGFFPSLQDLSVKCGFSWGIGSRNMQELVEPENRMSVRRRVYEFLQRMDMPLPPRVVSFSPAIIDNEAEILRVTEEVISDYEDQTRFNSDELLDEMLVGANLMFTRMKDVVLMVKPGDCIMNKATIRGLLALGCKALEQESKA